jgi:transcriptional regulator with XRE-family HTH domain
MAQSLTAEQLREHVRRQLSLRGITQQDYAGMMNVSTSYLSDFLSGKCEAGAKILHALGFTRAVRYVKVGQ